jgi:hypothetical protein
VEARCDCRPPEPADGDRRPPESRRVRDVLPGMVSLTRRGGMGPLQVASSESCAGLRLALGAAGQPLGRQQAPTNRLLSFVREANRSIKKIFP